MIRRLVILLGLALLPVCANAYEWRMAKGTNTLTFPANDTVGDEALWFARRVDFAGRARHDAWLIAASSVDFNGEVNFTGDVEGDLRIFSGSATLAGRIRQNVLAYARGLHLTTGSVVRGEAALIGETVICEGEVGSNAWIFANAATLGGRWNGNVRIYAKEIRIAPGTTIAGDLVYTAVKPPVLDSSVTVSGAVRQIQAVLPAASNRTRFAIHGYLFLAALLTGMPFVGFFPLLAGDAVRRLRTAPVRMLIAGAITLFLGPFLITFSFFTIIGIPLAILLGSLLITLVYLSHIVVALWLGHLLLRAPGPQNFSRVLSSLAMGLFILYFAGVFPAVAYFLVLPVLAFGTGALVLALFSRPLLPFPLPPPMPPGLSTPSKNE